MVDVRARPLSGPEGVWVEPVSGARTGVLVLAGSSGSVDERRATWLAERGAAAASIRWFGGQGQPPSHIQWDGKDETGMPLADGLYRYRLVVIDAAGRTVSSPLRMVEIATSGPQGQVPVLPVN